MTATERLRSLLDERGVEYETRDGKAIKNTYWNDSSDRRWGYTSDESGEIKDLQLFLVRGRMDVSPEQAIEATLGSDLKAENEKLRELVRDLWRFTGAACKRYPRLFDPSAQGGQMVQPNMIEAFEQRMHELGVEV